MPSERVQRHIDRLLDEADQAVAAKDWALVREHAQDILGLDPENADARAFLAAAERRLADAGGAPAGDGTQIAAPPAPSAAEPSSFAGGRYTVKRFLGEGGKKKVYLAHDTLLDRDVAFALIKTEGLDDAGRQRIRREAQAMGRLGAHPHIVSVFDLGEHEGQPFIVTELMGGGDVEGLIEQAEEHRPPLARVLEIGQAVCRGLEFAHSQRIVHRDLKPGNVWLTTGGTAKIGDFGLAVALDRSRLTQAGMMVGTVRYMPPEQALGGEVTPRSDLYSLGAMLYELVTGRPPFLGDESVAIISQHLNTVPVAPAWHRPDCPPALDALILRLLEKDPQKRPASAAEVREALAGIDLTAGRPDETPAAPAGADTALYQGTFVGRETELRRLRDAFDAACSGQGALLMVAGEPGIGKTALCEQLATYVAVRGGRTLVGHCYEEGSLSLPYLAFVEALRSYVLARPAEALRKELGSGAGEVARIVSEVRERADVELPAPGGDPEEARWRLLQVVTTFLRNAAAVQPLVLVLEDLHWADRGTLDLLVHLARTLAGARLLVVGTYRDVEVDRAHPLSGTLAELRRIGTFDRVPLRGLTVDEVQRMMSAIRGQEVPWSRAEAVYRQTEGNPLFVQEVLRYVVEEGLVTREAGRWRQADPSAGESGIPEGLRDVIGKRLSRLSPECNQVLAVASVIGRDFGLETLQRVADLAEEPLVAALEEALRAAVLQDQSRPGVIRYRFAHAFFRQTLYEELSAPRRLRQHQQVARALEVQYATRLDDHAAELAEHFAQSTDPADLAKAVHYSELAAGRAVAVYAYGEAARLLEQAIEVQEVLDPDDKTRRCDLLLALGEALMRAGNPRRVVDVIAPEALSLGQALGDDRRASRAARMALLALSRFGQAMAATLPEHRRWAELADRYAEPGSLDRVSADLMLASRLRMAGAFDEAYALNRSALDLARALGDADALFRIAAAQWAMAPQHEEERYRLAEEFAARSREGVDVRTTGAVPVLMGFTFLDHGERARAEAVWREAEELAARTKDGTIVLHVMAVQGLLAAVEGRLEEAVQTAERLLTFSEEAGIPLTGQLYASNVGRRPLLYLGRGEEALAATAELWRPEGGEEPLTISIFRGLCLAYLGHHAEARGILERCLRERQIKSPDDETDLMFLVQLLEIALEVGDQDACAILATRLAPVSHLATTHWILTSVARHLGAAAALLGDRAKARAYYEQALEVTSRIAFRPEMALTHLQRAELLLEGDPVERTEALEQLDVAIEQFRAMKMQPALARALSHKDVLKA